MILVVVLIVIIDSVFLYKLCIEYLWDFVLVKGIVDCLNVKLLFGKYKFVDWGKRCLSFESGFK